jgi:hypothetical protein
MIEAQNSQPVIPRRRNSVRGNHDVDFGLYRYRHLVETLAGVAPRFDKLHKHYEGVVVLACAFMWLPM